MYDYKPVHLFFFKSFLPDEKFLKRCIPHRRYCRDKGKARQAGPQKKEPRKTIILWLSLCTSWRMHRVWECRGGSIAASAWQWSCFFSVFCLSVKKGVNINKPPLIVEYDNLTYILLQFYLEPAFHLPPISLSLYLPFKSEHYPLNPLLPLKIKLFPFNILLCNM